MNNHLPRSYLDVASGKVSWYTFKRSPKWGKAATIPLMRLLFLTPAYPPVPGGGERYVQSLAHILSQRGHQLTVITSAAAAEADFWRGVSVAARDLPANDGVTIMRCSLRPITGGRAALMARRRIMAGISLLPAVPPGWLERLARAFPPLVGLDEVLARLPIPDVVHAFNLSWEYPALAGRHYAGIHHLPYFLTPYAHIGPGVNALVARYVTMPHQRRLLAAADAILTLTEATAAGLRDAGISCRHLRVIGAGIDPQPPPLPDDAISRFLLPTPFALFLGRANADKGALDAARAVLRLRRAGRSISLVLAGTATPEFTRFIARLPAVDRTAIYHLGPVSETEKHALLEACAMLLLPSRTDALGLVLLEAWQHARPVIGARAGGIPGVIDDGENGLLIDYGDVAGLAGAIGDLLAQPDRAGTMGEAGRRKNLTTYTWDEVARRVEAAYALAC